MDRAPLDPPLPLRSEPFGSDGAQMQTRLPGGEEQHRISEGSVWDWHRIGAGLALYKLPLNAHILKMRLL